MHGRPIGRFTADPGLMHCRPGSDFSHGNTPLYPQSWTVGGTAVSVSGRPSDALPEGPNSPSYKGRCRGRRPMVRGAAEVLRNPSGDGSYPLSRRQLAPDGTICAWDTTANSS